MMDFFL